MSEDTKSLIIEVACGNPGALTVIKDLMYFSKWFNMMVWCKSNLKGSELWEKYKDVFHQDGVALGNWIQDEMRKEAL